MRQELFPKRRLDGSFCIETRLAIEAKDPAVLASQINSWIEEWVRSNRYWKSKFAEAEGGVFDFFNEFARPPFCVTRASGSLFLRVEGCPGAGKWWRDWIGSRLLPDLRSAFKEIRPRPMENARNCPEDE